MTDATAPNATSPNPHGSPTPANAADTVRKTARGIGDKLSGPLMRCVFIALIAMFLNIPLGYVKSVVYDRMYSYKEATTNIVQSWGGSQTISGPVVMVPYQVWEDKKEIIKEVVKGKIVNREKVTRVYHTFHKAILPEELTFDATIDPEIRYRGIYKKALYNAPVDVRGVFLLPKKEDFAQNIHKVEWDKAWLSVGVSDLESISETSPAQWAGNPLPGYKPGSDAGNLLGSGFHTALKLGEKDAGERRGFSLKLKVRGSDGMSFTPVGERTTITMHGTWPSPCFKGNLLPVERSISDDGFTATWNISNLTRTYPQMADFNSEQFLVGRSKQSAITSFTAGVDLHESVSLYRMILRSVTYAILFIAVSFVALFAFEMVSRQRMHMLQYAMVGLSMSLFYLVLLSLAEHVSFGVSFIAASAVTVGMNSLYVGAALRSYVKGLIMAVLLSGLYALLFSILRMEDFALLMGTALVVTMMGVLMFVTRKLAPRANTPESVPA